MRLFPVELTLLLGKQEIQASLGVSRDILGELE